MGEKNKGCSLSGREGTQAGTTFDIACNSAGNISILNVLL